MLYGAISSFINYSLLRRKTHRQAQVTIFFVYQDTNKSPTYRKIHPKGMARGTTEGQGTRGDEVTV